MMNSKLAAQYLVGAAVVALFASACGQDSTETAGSGDTSSQRSSTDAPFSTESIEGFGTVLVDADGNALYTNEAESDGTIKCVEGCADFWPPLEAAADSVPSTIEGIDGEFGVMARPDGTDQVTLDGQPLYTFAEDRTPGSITGDGFEDDFGGDHFVWHVVGSESAGGEPAPDDADNEDEDKDDEEDDDGGPGGGY